MQFLETFSTDLFNETQSCTECENNMGVRNRNFLCKIHGEVDGNFAETCEDFL